VNDGVWEKKKKKRSGPKDDRLKKDSNFGEGQSSPPLLARFSSTSVGDRICLTQPSTTSIPMSLSR